MDESNSVRNMDDYCDKDYRDIVLVAGEDPYAYKGTEDISVPYLRPES